MHLHTHTHTHTHTFMHEFTDHCVLQHVYLVIMIATERMLRTSAIFTPTKYFPALSGNNDWHELSITFIHPKDTFRNLYIETNVILFAGLSIDCAFRYSHQNDDGNTNACWVFSKRSATTRSLIQNEYTSQRRINMGYVIHYLSMWSWRHRPLSTFWLI